MKNYTKEALLNLRITMTHKFLLSSRSSWQTEALRDPASFTLRNCSQSYKASYLVSIYLGSTRVFFQVSTFLKQPESAFVITSSREPIIPPEFPGNPLVLWVSISSQVHHRKYESKKTDKNINFCDSEGSLTILVLINYWIVPIQHQRN